MACVGCDDKKIWYQTTKDVCAIISDLTETKTGNLGSDDFWFSEASHKCVSVGGFTNPFARTGFVQNCNDYGACTDEWA